MSADLVPQAMAIARLVRDHGGRALVVGGFVRDRLLGRPSKDLDAEVFGIAEATLPELLARLGRVEAVGQAFSVYKVGAIDVALPRRESKTGRGHKGFTVTGDPDMPFEEAARRRDFTINAIGWDPLTNEYLDPCGGRADLDRRVLRVVDPGTFGDDSLRVLRALQLAARFDLTLDQSYGGGQRWIEVAPPTGSPVLVLSRRRSDEPRLEVPDQLPHSPIFFNCADIEETYRALVERGVKFTAPPAKMPFGWWSMFEDSEGTRYALGQW